MYDVREFRAWVGHVQMLHACNYTKNLWRCRPGPGGAKPPHRRLQSSRQLRWGRRTLCGTEQQPIRGQRCRWGWGKEVRVWRLAMRLKSGTKPPPVRPRLRNQHPPVRVAWEWKKKKELITDSFVLVDFFFFLIAFYILATIDIQLCFLFLHIIILSTGESYSEKSSLVVCRYSALIWKQPIITHFWGWIHMSAFEPSRIFYMRKMLQPNKCHMKESKWTLAYLQFVSCLFADCFFFHTVFLLLHHLQSWNEVRWLLGTKVLNCCHLETSTGNYSLL